MFAQIFLGIAMIIKGILHYMNSSFFINQRLKRNVGLEQFENFQKGLVLPHIMLGVVIILMGFIEKMNAISPSLFISIYIILVIIPLTLFLMNNKKFTGHYWMK